MDTSSTICHRLDIEIPRRMFVDISSIMKDESTCKGWQQFDLDNWTSIWLSKTIKCCSILYVVFSMSFFCWIDVTSKLAAWRNIGSCFHFVLCLVSPLTIYFKLNLKFEIWKALLIRCHFNVKLTWASNIYISFTLKWHHCHTRFADTQHNFEITHLHLNYTG